ncbi:DUF1205 domain-containing protein [Micromonospora sp. NBC_01699]|uniref:nucleotide disphospho-sugar-binding domain-containing protein n=1 Tax=Micromonospora sp. NBC_01699 TaxID=2975984 RepID=UPI002E2D1F10|nr:nucleotide disphospho-sugar-binding domain-containing protein [Micromonospora sp. NBC_01699]
MRILFTTVALSGHFFPLVPLAWAGRLAGHEVLVATSDRFVPVVLRSGLPASSCGPDVDFVELAAAATGHGPDDRRYAHGRAFGQLAEARLAHVRELVESWQPDVVVSERAEFAGPLAAAAHGIPQVEMHWGVPELPEYRAGAQAELRGVLADLGRDTLPRPARVINPWPPSLRLPHTTEHQGIRYVPYNGDAYVPRWVLEPRERARVCLTVGTLVPRLGADTVPGLVIPVLEALARLGLDVVVAVDDDVVNTWPPLPTAVRHAGRLPLAQVLGACDVVIHHGGQGTALTALASGVPQLVLPQFDDQADNAQAVVASGAGLSLAPGNATAQTVTEYTRELLGTVGFALAAAEVADEVAAQPTPAEIVDRLPELVVAAALPS